MSDAIQVLHVDDDLDFAEMTATILDRQSDRLIVNTHSSVQDALDRIATTDVDCVVSDYEMPDQNGIEFLETVRADNPDLPFILYTGKGSEEVASEAISAGVTDYLQKDTGTEQYDILANRIENAVTQTRANHRVRIQQQQVEQLHEATRVLMKQTTRTEIARHASETAREILDLPLNGVYLHDPDQDELVPRAITDEVRDVLGEPPLIRAGEGIAWTAYATGEPQIHEDVRDDPDILNPDTPIRSEFHLPLGPHGVLVAASTTPGDFTEADITAAKTLAANVEAALDRVEHEQELRDVEFQHEAAMEAGAIGTWEWQIPTDRVQSNPAFARLFDVDPDAARGGVPIDRFVSSIHEADRDRVEQAIQDAVGDCGEYEQEYRVWDSDGELRWVVARGHVECDGNGTPVRFPGAVTDVTDRRHREQALQRERNRLSAMFEAIPDPVTHVRRNDELQPIVKTVNSAFTDTFGIEQSEIQGRSIIDVTVPPDRRDDALEISRQMVAEGQIEREVERLTEEGRRTFLFRSNVFALPDGERESISVYTDITQRKARERKLEQQNERLDEFAGVVSHDLRNPLTVAKGRTRLVAEECESEHLEDVHRAHDRMEELIADLLSVARAGGDVAEFESVALAGVAERAWQTTSTGGAELSVETAQTINADRSRVRELLENLFKNAVEHAGPSVCVSIGSLADGFYIEDDGPGIAGSVRDRVFEAGYSSAEGNTGFGLSIVNRIAGAHGWTVRVTHGREGGARFEFRDVER